MNSNAKKKMIAAACAVVVILIAAASYVSHQHVLGNMAEQNEQLRSQVASLESQFSKLNDDLNYQRTQLVMTATQFDQALPFTFDIGAILGRLGDRLRVEGVKMRNRQVRTGDTQRSEMIARTLINMRFEGTFDDIYAVLKQIDSDDQILNADRMTISRPSGADLADGNGSENDSTEKLLEVELDISAFARQAKETDRWLTD